MLALSSSIEALELKIGIGSVLDLSGVDNSADVDRCLTPVNALAIEASHDFGGIWITVLLAQPG